MSRKCYLCGSDDPATRDHIPPRGFFPWPRPTNLITVPCCSACNAAFAPEDDYFRLVFSSLIGRSPSGDKIWEEKTLTGSVRRLPSEVDKILESISDVAFQTENGTLEASSFQIDRERMCRYAVRLTKGLLSHHFPDYDYSQSSFGVRFILPTVQNLESLAPIRDLLRYDERGDRVFRYRFGLTDTKNSGLWMLTFYEAALLLVFHTNNER